LAFLGEGWILAIFGSIYVANASDPHPTFFKPVLLTFESFLSSDYIFSNLSPFGRLDYYWLMIHLSPLICYPNKFGANPIFYGDT